MRPNESSTSLVTIETDVKYPFPHLTSTGLKFFEDYKSVRNT